MFEELDLENPLGTSLPHGVSVTERISADGVGIVFVMNFSYDQIRIQEIGHWTDVETGERIVGELNMKGFECRILKKR